MRAIFGEKSKNVSDNSLRVPKGTSGRVINVRVFRRTKGYELSDGSISLVRIFIAQIRKKYKLVIKLPVDMEIKV